MILAEAENAHLKVQLDALKQKDDQKIIEEQNMPVLQK
jgi:hypothetical protein